MIRSKKVLLLVLAAFLLFLLFRKDIFFRFEEPERFEEEEIALEVAFSSGEDLSPWREHVLAEEKTFYDVQDTEYGRALKARSSDSSSVIYLRKDLDIERAPRLNWDWRVLEFPEKKKPESLSDEDEFDFAAQVYVVFDSLFFVNAKAIQYVWSEDLAEGTVEVNPFTENIRTVVIRSGYKEGWASESRDVKEDYEKFFQSKAKRDIQAVAILTDSDATSSDAVALYRDLTVTYMRSELDKHSIFRVRKPGEVEVKTDERPRRRPGLIH